jgi:Co/Zn/Cd efflux system component
MLALLIGYESVERLVNAIAIDFAQAMPMAILGLAVNLASAWLRSGGAHYQHGAHHQHRDRHDHDNHDHLVEARHAETFEGRHHRTHRDKTSLRPLSHVVADTAVSVLVT